MVGFLDSGIGGVNVLNKCKSILKGHKVVYFCDDKNMPYGNKSAKKIKAFTFKNCKKLVKLGAKTIVLACNTATACSIKALRNKFKNVCFVGTEPNIKAPINEGKKKILVLATKQTLNCCEIIKNNIDRIEVLACKNLAYNIENNQEWQSEILNTILPNEYDAVVIGCTHYYFVLDKLKKLFYNAKFYSSLEGIKKQLNKCLNGVKIITSSKNDKKRKQIEILLTSKK